MAESVGRHSTGLRQMSKTRDCGLVVLVEPAAPAAPELAEPAKRAGHAEHADPAWRVGGSRGARAEGVKIEACGLGDKACG